MDKLLNSYRFRTLDNLKSYVEDYCIETAEDLVTACFNHFDMRMRLEDAQKLLEATQK